MKLSTKIILPIILISALLILLTGCTGIVTTDESPGFTPGTITGIIAAPCCENSVESADGDTTSPEYWCFYCEKEWKLQDGVEVVLTYGEDEVATTTTNEFGEYSFANVSPGKNYVVTAYCPDYDDDRPLVKDVALELVEGGYFDTKITDIVSTSLGLVVDFLVDFTILGPEDIVLDEVIAEKPDFKKFPKFRKLIDEVVRVLEVCQDVNADDELQYALCRAAEEISGLNIGCGPGYTPPPVVVKYTLTTAANPPAGGLVSGAGTYSTGTVVPVTASPATDWEFVNWSGNLSGTTNPTSITMNSNKSVTANFRLIPTYSVTYDNNTGTGSQSDGSSPYYAGATVTVLDEGTMVKTNYTFSHWDTQADDNGTNYNPAETFPMPAANVTLYAQWTEDTKYDVIYDLNGGTSGSQSDGSSPYYAGATVTVLDENDMELAGGYIFSHWDTQANDGGTDYDPADTFTMPAANVTLYAQWVCDPCSGWEAEGVTVYLYYEPGTPGHSDPRIDVDGAITGPACAEVTEIDIVFELYNNGGAIKESYSAHLTAFDNTFEVDLDIDPASYNAGDNYKLWITIPGCSEMMIIEGPIIVL